MTILSANPAPGRRITILAEVRFVWWKRWRIGFVKVENYARGGGNWWFALYRRD